MPRFAVNAQSSAPVVAGKVVVHTVYSMDDLKSWKSKDGSKDYMSPKLSAVDVYSDGTLSAPRDLSYTEGDYLPVVTKSANQDADEDKILAKAKIAFLVASAVLEGYGIDAGNLGATSAPTHPVAKVAPPVAKVAATRPAAAAVPTGAPVMQSF